MKASQKIFVIAKSLGELNQDIKVKGFSFNEVGYAKVKKFVGGICDWDDGVML
jgi:hypothetical protein